MYLTMSLSMRKRYKQAKGKKCKRYTYSGKTDEINGKKGIKRLKKLTPTRKCTHIGPFTHLWTTGITAL